MKGVVTIILAMVDAKMWYGRIPKGDVKLTLKVNSEYSHFLSIEGQEKQKYLNLKPTLSIIISNKGNRNKTHIPSEQYNQTTSKIKTYSLF